MTGDREGVGKLERPAAGGRGSRSEPVGGEIPWLPGSLRKLYQTRGVLEPNLPSDKPWSPETEPAAVSVGGEWPPINTAGLGSISLPAAGGL